MFSVLYGHGRVDFIQCQKFFDFLSVPQTQYGTCGGMACQLSVIKPLRHLKSFDLSRADGNNMSKARKVLKALTGELTDEDVSALSISDRDNLLRYDYMIYIYDLI